MKKTILLIVILVSAVSFSQNNVDAVSKKKKQNTSEKFTYDASGLSPRDVTMSVRKSKKGDLYSKTLDWLDEKYKNGNQVIEKKEKNDKIRFEGFTDNAICYGTGADYGCEGLTYQIEISFEDGQYKLKPLKLSYDSTKKGKVNMNLNKSEYYDKNGKIDNDYSKVPSQIETLFNGLNESLLNYLTNEDQEDEW